MDKSLKILGGALLAIGAAVVYRYWFKQEQKKLETEQKENDQELEDLGVPVEKLREQIDPDEDSSNMTKMLATGTMFNPNWSDEVVDPDEALDRAGNIILITQKTRVHTDRYGIKHEDQDLVFCFDIPNYMNGSYRDCKVGDFVVAFKEAAEHIWNTYAKFSRRPKCQLVGVWAFTYDDPRDNGDPITELVEIDDPSIYEEFATEYNDGLASFYEAVNKKALPKTVEDKLNAWVSEKGYFDKPNLETSSFDLMYQISFNIQNETGIGINLKQALEALRYLTEEFTVKKRGYNASKKEIQYDSVIFCAPSEITGEHDLTWYYRKEDGRLVVDNYTY